jgi:transposase-like protein
MIAADLRKRRPKPHTSWHLHEVYVKLDGRMVYLWRAVDAEGEILDAQSKRDKHRAEAYAKAGEEIRFRARSIDH